MSNRDKGSGFIISDDGYILTNNHVVGGADEINVQMADGRSLKAKLIGADDKSDVAVIKVAESDLPTLSIANSSDLEIGEWVMAVGNPFGLSATLTVGVVSATGRAGMGITDYEEFIQTDAAINPVIRADHSSTLKEKWLVSIRRFTVEVVVIWA